MTTNDDDFWGNQAEWPEVPEGERKAPRPHGGARVSGEVSRWWNRIVGGGVEGTRQHGRHGAASRTHDDFHDDWDNDNFDLAPDEPIAEPGPVRQAATEARRPTEPTIQSDTVDETWDDEWVIESDPTPSPGVDPLLARLGGLAIVTTLLIPLALGLRSHDESPSAVDVTNAVVTMAAPVDTTALSTAAAQTVAPDTVASTSAASSAPVAVPTVPSPAPTTSAPATIAVDQSAELNTAPNTAEPNTGGVTTPAVADEAADRQQSCAVDYEVVQGDFWIRLADASGLPLDEILDANDATVDTPLFPGATICLPEGATVPAPPTTAAPTTAPATTAPATTAPATTMPAAPPATTKPVTTAAPPTTGKPVVTYPTISAASAAQIIRDVWPDELEGRAIEIATRESTLVVTAKNSCCYGLFQINWEPHKAWLGGLGITSPDQLFDGATNAKAAFALYQRSGGWGPWT
jgi:LysM domain